MEEDMYTKEDLSHFDKAVKAISEQNDDSDPGSRSQGIKKTAKRDTDSIAF